MAARLQTPRILANRLILQADRAPIVLLDGDGTKRLARSQVRAATEDDAAAEEIADRFAMLAYRQTELPAAKGGKANANGFRFRHKAMRAIARTFRGAPFISGHDWGDVRARGGTLVDAWGDSIDLTLGGVTGELGIYAEAELTAEWALEAFANGTIDRFSIGAQGEGEITCTVHDTPVWQDCWCWPGREVEHEGAVVTAEWEYESARGVEISAVNVPAVDGTAIVNARETPSGEHLEALTRMCGRVIPETKGRTHVDLGARPNAGYRAPRAPITMTPSHATPRGDLMDRAQICASLGLPLTATDAEILARTAELTAAAADRDVARSQLDAQHVEAELERLRASHVVTDQVIATLRTAATGDAGRAAFDSQIALVRATAPKVTASVTATNPATRPALQSETPPAPIPTASAATFDDDGVDAFDQHKDNPHLKRFMRWSRDEKNQSLTEANVREYGPRAIAVLPNLSELAAATDARG